MIFVGDDWSEDHHDVEVQDEQGRRLAQRRLPEGVAGVAALHDLLGGLADEPEEVVVGIETENGINPLRPAVYFSAFGVTEYGV